MKLALPPTFYKFLFFAIFFFSFNLSFSQDFKFNLALGGSNYQGDLSNGYISALKPAVSGGFSYNIFENIRLRTNLSYLQIGGDDVNSAKAKARNLNFKSNIFEAAELLEIDLLNSEDNNIVPYIFGGPSIFHFDPTTTVKQMDIDNFNAYFPGVANPLSVGQKIHLHDIGTEGQLFQALTQNARTYPSRVYELTQTNWQLGGGVRIQLSEAISVAYEFSFRRVNTDYLDDVSAGNYIGGNEFKAQINDAVANNNLSRANLLREGQVLSWRYLDKGGSPVVLPAGNPDRPRGNPSQNDAYFSNQIRINITIFDLFGSGSGGGNVGGKEYYNSSHKKLFSPRNPFGTGQLRCPRIY